MATRLKSPFKTIATGTRSAAPKWILCIPGIDVQRNYSRQFSDGVVLARAIHHYEPKLVELHNYSSALSLEHKKANWETLNRKVLPKLNIKLKKKQIDQIIEIKPGAIDEILSLVGQKLVVDPVTSEPAGDKYSTKLSVKSDPPKTLIGKSALAARGDGKIEEKLKTKAKFQSRFSPIVSPPVSNKGSLVPIAANQASTPRVRLKRSDTFTISKSSAPVTDTARRQDVAEIQPLRQTKKEQIAEKKKRIINKWLDSFANEFATKNYLCWEDEAEQANCQKEICDNLVKSIWDAVKKPSEKVLDPDYE